MLPWRPTNPTPEEATSIPAFITQFNPMDVFMGRGTPSVRHEGNVFFRKLIDEQKYRYATCDSNTDKDAVARGVVSTVASRNGRFLQKIATKAQASALGVPHYIKDAWVYAPEEAVLIKVKQCFRDLYKKSEQNDTVDSPMPTYTKNARYSNGLSSPEAAAAASMPSASLQGVAQALYTNDRRAAALQLLREQQRRIESMQYPASSSVGTNPVMALIRQKNQQFYEDQLARANADTILRRKQGQKASSFMGAFGDPRQREEMARRPSDNSGIINSVLGPPDEAGLLSFQQAVAAQKAGLPSALYPDAASMDQAADLPTSTVSNAKARENNAAEDDDSAPLHMNDRDQLAQEIQNQKFQNDGSSDGKMSPSVAIKATEKGSLNQHGSYYSNSRSNDFRAGNQQNAAMLSLLRERQQHKRPQRPAYFQEKPPEVRSASEPMISMPSLSVLSAVLGTPSEPLPSTLEDANQKIEAARWVIAQLIATSKRPISSSSPQALRQSPVEESKPPASNEGNSKNSNSDEDGSSSLEEDNDRKRRRESEDDLSNFQKAIQKSYSLI